MPDAERDVKVPAWLNDVSLYHNRGNTTFAGENSQYGDFFGLDDLFTENPKVVNGMIDIYKTWIRDFRIDGFRMDTMKHVDDAFWQKFAPAIERYAKSQGVRDFYMFGEVAEDTSRPITSHYMTHDDVQGVLDFPFQTAATRFAANSAPTSELGAFFRDDDWYTDGDSNVYNLPTFLGNHDKGRIGMFIRNANPGAAEAELLQRDRLAHALMYFSRGNPVVYYGDEQGFTGNGGDQDARQDMFPSQSPQYNNQDDDGVTGDDGAGKNDNIGSDATPMDDNFDPSHPLYRELKRLAAVTRRHPTLRDGAQQDRVSSSGPGVYAFSRIDRSRRREYVVALNNAEAPASASIPTYVRKGKWEKVYGDGPGRLRSGRDRHLDVTVGPLSAVVYRAEKRIPRSRRAPSVALDVPADGPRPPRGRRGPRARHVLRGDVPGQGRRRPLAGRRHGRQRALPGLPRRVRHRAGDARAVPRGRARQRAPHALERGPLDHDRPAGDRARGAEPGRARARDRRGARDRDAGPRQPRRDVPALRRRRRLHGHRHRRARRPSTRSSTTRRAWGTGRA